MRHDDGFWKLANRILEGLVGGAFVCLILLGVYSVYDGAYVYLHANPLPLLSQAGEAADPWHDLPEDAVGWIEVDDTGICFPVMQGEDNETYLNRSADGEFSLAGSVFLDYRNRRDWTDAYNLLYGHHMSGGRMFGSLDAFLDEAYLEAHSTGLLRTGEGDCRLSVFAVALAEASDPLVFQAGTDVDTKQVMAWIKDHARICKQDRAKQILAMSTCQDSGSTRRLIVFAEMLTDR